MALNTINIAGTNGKLHMGVDTVMLSGRIGKGGTRKVARIKLSFSNPHPSRRGLMAVNNFNCHSLDGFSIEILIDQKPREGTTREH